MLLARIRVFDVRPLGLWLQPEVKFFIAITNEDAVFQFQHSDLQSRSLDVIGMDLVYAIGMSASA